jgi:arylformamidase
MTVPVFLHYDRAALDAQYDNRTKVPAFAQWFERWKADGARARALPGSRLDLSYGPGAVERVNVFPAQGVSGPAPVVVALHGGYWMALAKEDFDFVALGLAPRGVAVVSVDYALMPGVRMDEVVRQCRAAVAWTLAHAASFGGDPHRVWVAGHSAGGHLTMTTAAADWSRWRGVPAGLQPRGGFSFSGLNDLEPIRLSYLNDTLRLDAGEAARNGPLSMPAPAEGDWTLWVGGLEGPEYLRQSVDLAARWGTDGRRRVAVEVLAGHDHFSITAPLADPASALSRRIAAAVGGLR